MVVTVMVRGLPANTSLWAIRKLCGEHGEVKRVTIPKGSRGYSSRYAFVHMYTAEGAAAVFDGLHGSELKGCTITTAYPMQKRIEGSLWNQLPQKKKIAIMISNGDHLKAKKGFKKKRKPRWKKGVKR